MRTGWSLAALATFALCATARAEPPTCFPERTVLDAAPFLDADGNLYGGLRAGATVKVLDDFIGKEGDQALVEIREPVTMRVAVSRRWLLAFTRAEIEFTPGFARWVAGAPVVVGRVEAGHPRISLHDPLCHPEARPSVLSSCDAIRGSPEEIVHRGVCRGAIPRLHAALQGNKAVFLKHAVRLRSATGNQSISVPGEEWLYLIEQKGRSSFVEYRNWLGYTLYVGRVPTAGMRKVPNDVGRAGGALCCTGALPLDLPQRADDLPEAIIGVPAPLSATRGGERITTLPYASRVRVLREDAALAEVLFRWPTWEASDYTFEVKGWLAKDRLATPSRPAVSSAGGAAEGPDAGEPDAATRSAPPPATESGRPVCVRQGTRSEGWAWPSGRFIRWGKCNGVTPVCRAHGKDGSGWYAQGALIAAASCPQ